MTRILDRITDAICALVLFGMVAITVIDVSGRYLFNQPLPGGFEVSELLLALAIFAGLPAVTRDGSHITVDLWTSHLGERSKRVQQKVSDGVSFIVCAALATFMHFKAGDVAAQRDATSYLNFPLYPIAYFMSLSCAVAAIIFALRVWRNPSGRLTPAAEAGDESWR